MDNYKPPPSARSVHPLSDHEVDLTWRMTCAYIRSDFERFLSGIGSRGNVFKRAYWWLLPSIQALFWYRVSRHLYIKGWRTPAMFVFLFNQYLTRAELPPSASIGPECLIGHATGVVILGRVGRRFTIYGQGGTGGGIDPADVGGGSGLPWVGDDVTFSFKAMALGPIRIHDGARLGPAVVVTRDVPERALVVGAASRIQRTAPDATTAPEPEPADATPTAQRVTDAAA